MKNHNKLAAFAGIFFCICLGKFSECLSLDAITNIPCCIRIIHANPDDPLRIQEKCELRKKNSINEDWKYIEDACSKFLSKFKGCDNSFFSENQYKNTYKLEKIAEVEKIEWFKYFKTCFVFPKKEIYSSDVFFDENIRMQVTDIINVILADEDEQIKANIINFGQKRPISNIGDNISCFYDEKKNLIQLSNRVYSQKFRDTNKSAFICEYMHELGHYYLATYLSILGFLNLQNDPLIESISILFELLSCIVEENPEGFYRNITDRCYESLMSARIAQYEAINNIQTSCTMNREYMFGTIFALKMIHDHGNFCDGKFSFNINGVKDEIKLINQVFLGKGNIILHFQEKFFKSNEINNVLSVIEKYFQSKEKDFARKKLSENLINELSTEIFEKFIPIIHGDQYLIENKEIIFNDNFEKVYPLAIAYQNAYNNAFDTVCSNRISFDSQALQENLVEKITQLNKIDQTSENLTVETITKIISCKCDNEFLKMLDNKYQQIYHLCYVMRRNRNICNVGQFEAIFKLWIDMKNRFKEGLINQQM